MPLQKFNCDKCQNKGWILEQNQNGEPRVKPCSCEFGIRMILKRKGIPEKFIGCSFDNFQTIVNGREIIQLKKAKTKLRDYVELFPVTGRILKRKNGFLIMGTVGAGKTHLCVAVARGLVEKGYYSIRFVDYKELLDDIKSTFSGYSEFSESDILDPVLNAGLLIIDDLGSERNTEWTEDVFARIINYRYNRGLPVIVSTNYFDRPVKGAISDELFSEKVGARVRSRLYEMCEEVELIVEDYRKLKNK